MLATAQPPQQSLHRHMRMRATAELQQTELPAHHKFHVHLHEFLVFLLNLLLQQVPLHLLPSNLREVRFLPDRHPHRNLLASIINLRLDIRLDQPDPSRRRIHATTPPSRIHRTRRNQPPPNLQEHHPSEQSITGGHGQCVLYRRQ